MNYYFPGLTTNQAIVHDGCFNVRMRKELSYIFNRSFIRKKLPNIWKISRVCRIPKCNPCRMADLLKLIPLTSFLVKVYMQQKIKEIKFRNLERNRLP